LRTSDNNCEVLKKLQLNEEDFYFKEAKMRLSNGIDTKKLSKVFEPIETQ
jgi:hypothetical protein